MKNTAPFPKISVVILTLNDEDGIRRALESVKRQIYPKDRIEIIVIDNGSKDNSVEVAKRYTKHVYVSLKNQYENRSDGMRMATGEYIFMVLEQDIEFRGKYFLQRMVKPLIDNQKLVASFTRIYPRNDQPWVTRFISYHPVQCDPLFEFLTPSIESTIIKKENGYFLCRYIVGKIPPTTHMLFRKSYVQKTPVWKQKKDFDHDTVIGLINSGYTYFAYVPDAGYYHNHAKNLTELVAKRIRNLDNHYFPQYDTLQYTWLDENNRYSAPRLLLWIIYANLFIPEFIRGYIRFIKYRDWGLLMQPVISIVTTDAILFHFISNPMGRKIIYSSIRKMF